VAVGVTVGVAVGVPVGVAVGDPVEVWTFRAIWHSEFLTPVPLITALLVKLPSGADAKIDALIAF
jgi:predicted MFS family arabinose efflux permease